MITGLGPDVYYFGDETAAAKDMQGAPGVNNARDYFRDVKQCSGLSDYGASFGVYDAAQPGQGDTFPTGGSFPAVDQFFGGYRTGVDGQFVAGASMPAGPTSVPMYNFSLAEYPTRQFMGSYSVNITNNGNGSVTFLLGNTMSLRSLGLRLLPSYDRSPIQLTPFGNVNIYVSWTEPSPCR